MNCVKARKERKRDKGARKMAKNSNNFFSHARIKKLWKVEVPVKEGGVFYEGEFIYLYRRRGSMRCLF